MNTYEEIMNALAIYFGDGGGINPSEESIKEIIGQEHDPISTIATALGTYRGMNFDAAAKPLIRWLSENVNPHHSVIVTPVSAELVATEQTFQTEEFLKD